MSGLRVVHLTDLHYLGPVEPRGLASKRLLGLANLYLAGRVKRFGGAPRDALIDDVLGLHPDLVVISGDLTTLATEAEFALAREALDPLLRALPVVTLAGNHDRYTRGAARSRRMERTFGPWMTGGRWDAAAGRWSAADPEPPVRFQIDGVEVFTVESARPSPVSRGALRRAELEALAARLASPATDRFRLLALHYPLLTTEGRPYTHPLRGLGDVRRLLALLRRHPVGAVVHGHEHRWRLSGLPCDDGGVVPVINGGSSGLSPGGGRDPGYVVLETAGPRLDRLWRRRWRDDGYADQPLEIPRDAAAR